MPLPGVFLRTSLLSVSRNSSSQYVVSSVVYLHQHIRVQKRLEDSADEIRWYGSLLMSRVSKKTPSAGPGG